MSQSLQELLSELSVEEQAAVDARFQELYAEEMTLRDLRKARQLTQEHLANELHVRQESVSRLEKRSDLLLSTLAHDVEAMGGTLKIMVEFPDRPPVRIQGLYGTMMGQAKIKLVRLMIDKTYAALWFRSGNSPAGSTGVLRKS